MMQWELTNATIVTPDKVVNKGFISINGNKIERMGRASAATEKPPAIDINELIVLPGLIDCHDHLLGTYLPRVGDRKPYLNWLVWDNDLKASPIYAERQQIESADLYLLGEYRHLISGVTSVQDHIPHFVQDMFKKDSAIRIIDRFSVAHSVTSFALKWGDSIEKEHELAVKNSQPFIAHCSEGYDEETLASVQSLINAEALTDHSVLVHGIAFSDEDIAKLAEAGSHVVWCPVSNLYMFNETARVKELIDSKVNVCLGTDSPMSGSVNIFEELYIAKQYYQQQYSEELDDKVLLEMLTTNASKAMFLPELGSLEEGKLADIIVIDGDKNQPYQSFQKMGFENIMLVAIDGKPRFADHTFIPLFEALKIPFQKVKVAGSKKIVDGDVLGLIERVRKAVGFKKELAFLPIEPW